MSLSWANDQIKWEGKDAQAVTGPSQAPGSRVKKVSILCRSCAGNPQLSESMSAMTNNVQQTFLSTPSLFPRCSQSLSVRLVWMSHLEMTLSHQLISALQRKAFLSKAESRTNLCI